MTKIMNADRFLKIALEDLEELNDFESYASRKTKLVILTATNDEAPMRYVSNKKKMGKEFQIEVEQIHFNKECTNEDICNKIEELNNDETVDGIILQLSTYDHINDKIMELINAEKDADSLTTFSKVNYQEGVGDWLIYTPCTPYGVLKIIESYDINIEDIEDKNVVIVGRGETSGSPMAELFNKLNANVTVLHSRTSNKNLEKHIKEADIVVSCVGKRNLLKADWFKEGSIVIGVGLSYDEKGRQHLDFEVDEVVKLGKARYVTNRINCTGTATVISLMLKTILLRLKKSLPEEKYIN